MCFHMISSISKIISTTYTARSHAHTTKFRWMLDHNAVNAFAKFHSQILRRERITILQMSRGVPKGTNLKNPHKVTSLSLENLWHSRSWIMKRHNLLFSQFGYARHCLMSKCLDIYTTSTCVRITCATLHTVDEMLPMAHAILCMVRWIPNTLLWTGTEAGTL